MAWLRKVRPVLYVAGVLLAVGSLLGARLLSPGSGGGGDPQPKPAAAPDSVAKAGTGPVVIGYVDSDPPPVTFILPPLLQSGQVSEVHVKFGVHVSEGQKLYEFDATTPRAKQRHAEKQVLLAEADVRVAEELGAQHKTQLELQQQAIANARLKRKSAEDALNGTRDNFRRSIRASGVPEAEIERRVENEPDVLRMKIASETATREAEFEEAKLRGLQRVNPQVQVEKAEAAVALAKAAKQEADEAVAMCVVRAKLAGTVERVTISKGDTLGIGTRVPAVTLIPDGTRVVRAEVEAEFAHKVGPDKKGKEVTIFDHSDARLTYRGVVRDIGSAFLPKRRTEGGFVPNDTLVLEVVVEVLDPAPAGKPPLRVGQKVRVNFGQ